MNVARKPILIMKTGSTIPAIASTLGDFEDWIIAGMALPAEHFRVVSVFRDELMPAPESCAGVVITGSPAMVTENRPWIGASCRFVLDAIRADIPLLGICFGHQLMARALGGRVDWHPAGREIGTTTVSLEPAAATDPLFNGLPGSFPVHVTHMQSVLEIPETASLLATNAFEPNHGLRFAARAWGVQFHPEFDEAIMAGYLRERFDRINGEGLDAAGLLANVRPAPEAGSLLPRFAAICQDFQAV